MADVAPFFLRALRSTLFSPRLCGVIAHHKGRNVLGWTLLGFLGLIPLIIESVLPNLNDQRNRDAYQSEENRRLREQLRQERIKSESFRQHAAARLDAHDQHLGLDTARALARRCLPPAKPPVNSAPETPTISPGSPAQAIPAGITAGRAKPTARSAHPKSPT